MEESKIGAWLLNLPDGEISRYGFYVLCIFGIALLWVWHVRDNSFSVRDFITDKTGRADRFALAYVGSFLVSLWVLWYLTVTKQLSEWFYTAFIGAYVAGGVFNAWQKRNRNDDDDDDDKGDGK